MSSPGVPVASAEPGQTGADLLAEPRRSAVVDVRYFAGVVESDGVARARSPGVAASAGASDAVRSVGGAARGGRSSSSTPSNHR